MEVKIVAGKNLPNIAFMMQTGGSDWKRSLLDFISNGFDAMPNGGMMTFRTEGCNTLIYEDNGVGMGDTKDEIIQNFFVLGDSNKVPSNDDESDNDFIGYYGLGRCQIMASTSWDFDKNRQTGSHQIRSGNFLIHNVNIENLTANIEEVDNYHQGVEWTIEVDRPLFYESEIERYILNNIIIPKNIIVMVGNHAINNNILWSGSNELFDYYIDKENESSEIEIYNKGIRVTKIYNIPLCGRINTKKSLRLNIDRREIIKNNMWDEIVNKLMGIAYLEVILDGINNISPRMKSEWLKLYHDDQDRFRLMRGANIVPLANEKYTSISDIIKAYENGQTIYTTYENNSRIADKAINMGHIVIYQYWNTLVTSILDRFGVKTEYFDNSNLYETINKASYQYINDSVHQPFVDWLMKVFQQSFGFGEKKIVIGYSSDEIPIYTDENKDIIIDEKHIDEIIKRCKYDYNLAAINIMDDLAHELSHERSNKDEHLHDSLFDSRYIENIKSMMKEYIEYITGEKKDV